LQVLQFFTGVAVRYSLSYVDSRDRKKMGCLQCLSINLPSFSTKLPLRYTVIAKKQEKLNDYFKAAYFSPTIRPPECVSIQGPVKNTTQVASSI